MPLRPGKCQHIYVAIVRQLTYSYSTITTSKHPTDLHEIQYEKIDSGVHTSLFISVNIGNMATI